MIPKQELLFRFFRFKLVYSVLSSLQCKIIEKTSNNTSRPTRLDLMTLQLVLFLLLTVKYIIKINMLQYVTISEEERNKPVLSSSHNTMHGPASWSSSHANLASPDAWDLRYHTSCCIFTKYTYEIFNGWKIMWFVQFRSSEFLRQWSTTD